MGSKQGLENNHKKFETGGLTSQGMRLSLEMSAAVREAGQDGNRRQGCQTGDGVFKDGSRPSCLTNVQH
jgi:hypothetical protein